MNRRELLAYGVFGMTAGVLPPVRSRARSQDANLDAIGTIGIHPAIDPDSRSVTAPDAIADGQLPEARLDGGALFSIDVPRGELRTDEAGRLLVLGGMRRPGPAVPDLLAVTFGI